MVEMSITPDHLIQEELVGREDQSLESAAWVAPTVSAPFTAWAVTMRAPCRSPCTSIAMPTAMDIDVARRSGRSAFYTAVANLGVEVKAVDDPFGDLKAKPTTWSTRGIPGTTAAAA